jgi:hypothetical protein
MKLGDIPPDWARISPAAAGRQVLPLCSENIADWAESAA